MYNVLDKYIIKSQIVPYLPLAKRGFQATVPLEEIVNAVLYKLKTGVQWLIIRDLGSVVRKKKSIQMFVLIKEMEMQIERNILTNCFIMSDIKSREQMLG